MLRIWNISRALGLLAPSMLLSSQVLTKEISHSSIPTIDIDEDYSTTVAVHTCWATAEPLSPQERSVPNSAITESSFVSTVWVEETVYKTVTVTAPPTSTSFHSWTTATTPCPHVDDTKVTKPIQPGKRSILERDPVVSTVEVVETMYVTITVEALPSTGGASQRTWTTATTPCPHDTDENIMEPILSGRRAVDVREPDTTTAVDEVKVTTGEIVFARAASDYSVGLDLNSMIEKYHPTSTFTVVKEGSIIGLDLSSMIENFSPASTFLVQESAAPPSPPPTSTITITKEASSKGLDLSSMIDNFSPASTFTVQQAPPPPPPPATAPIASTTHEEVTVYLPDSTTTIAPPSTLILTFTSTMKPEDVPGYWLKGGIVSTRGHAVQRRHEDPSSVTTDYTHDAHPTVQASEWLGRFRNFARREVTTKSSSVYDSSIPKSNEARDRGGGLVSGPPTKVPSTGLYTSTETAGLVFDEAGTGKVSEFILWKFSDGKPIATDFKYSKTGSQHTTTTQTTSSSYKPSLEVSTLLQETTLVPTSRSTTIWPDSATSWKPSSTPTPASLEWDWWKGTKWQKPVAAKEVRSEAAAAAVEQRAEMNGWKSAENSISPWVVTFVVILAALTFALL